MTKDFAQLSLTVEAPDMGGPRQGWRFALSHRVPKANREPNGRGHDRMFKVEIAEMGIQVRRWQELAGLTIRTTPEWLVKVEECGPYGQLVNPVMSIFDFKAADDTGRPAVHEDWTAIEYELRFGQWNDGYMACELDAWAVPEAEYERNEPETAEELARFADGPPNLRVITRAAFAGGRIEMERCGDDPVPLALQRLEQSIGSVDVFSTEVQWPPLFLHGLHKETVSEPGWRGSVGFQTGW